MSIHREDLTKLAPLLRETIGELEGHMGLGDDLMKTFPAFCAFVDAVHIMVKVEMDEVLTEAVDILFGSDGEPSESVGGSESGTDGA